MRLPTLALAVALGLALAACGGGSASKDSTKAATGVVPTATPYPRLPTPQIVSGSITAGSGSVGANETRYVIQSGDSLSALAVRFDTTVDAIVKRNGLTDASDIKAGQELIVPSTRASSGASTATATPRATSVPTQAATAATATRTATAVTTATAAATATSTSGRQTYTVQKGDTASDIADEFGVTLDALAAANDMTVAELTDLQAGQTIVIPRPTR